MTYHTTQVLRYDEHTDDIAAVAGALRALGGGDISYAEMLLVGLMVKWQESQRPRLETYDPRTERVV